MTEQPARNIEYRPLEELQGDPRNPKEHDVEIIDASLSRFGMLDLIVLDERTGQIVSGHGRKKTLEGMAARDEDPPEGVRVDDQGRWHVPVITGWASESDEQSAAALIAMNRATELGGWADESLLDLLDQLAETDGLDGVGYSDDDIEALQALTGRLGDEIPPPRDLDDLYDEVGDPTDEDQLIEIRIQVPEELAPDMRAILGETPAQNLQAANRIIDTFGRP